jgi:rubrerythrin
MEEWIYEKNNNIDPTQIGRGSGIKAWWKCKKCGHEWETSISNRVMGRGCPICSKKKNL